MSNTNCLEDVRCPDCGNEDRLMIVARVMCLVTDDGSDPFGDHEWDEDSFAGCPECGRDGPLSDFRADAARKRGAEAINADPAAAGRCHGPCGVCEEAPAELPRVPGRDRDAGPVVRTGPWRMTECKETRDMNDTTTTTHHGERLPPDPEGMNDDRAGWAAAAVEAFRAATGTDYEDAVCDLLCDLMHLCDRDGDLGDFEAQLGRARGHYEAETAGEAGD